MKKSKSKSAIVASATMISPCSITELLNATESTITMKILMVLTSHDKLGNTGRKTGFWLEEFAAPYFTFLDTGATVTVASPKAGQPPLDPVSDMREGQTELTRRFKQEPAAHAVLAKTLRFSDVTASDYVRVSYPMGPCRSV